MNNLLLVFQIILSITLTGLVLVQARGTGFGRSGAGGASFTRRGVEKIVFKSTFAITALFILVSILTLSL